MPPSSRSILGLFGLILGRSNSTWDTVKRVESNCDAVFDFQPAWPLVLTESNQPTGITACGPCNTHLVGEIYIYIYIYIYI